MATVTRKFRDDFEVWAADRIASGSWTALEVEELKGLLRIDLAPGPDQLRAGMHALNTAGVEVPAAIDDHEERYRMWANFFAVEASAINLRNAPGATNDARQWAGIANARRGP